VHRQSALTREGERRVFAHHGAHGPLTFGRGQIGEGATDGLEGHGGDTIEQVFDVFPSRHRAVAASSPASGHLATRPGDPSATRHRSVHYDQVMTTSSDHQHPAPTATPPSDTRDPKHLDGSRAYGVAKRANQLRVQAAAVVDFVAGPNATFLAGIDVIADGGTVAAMRAVGASLEDLVSVG